MQGSQGTNNPSILSEVTQVACGRPRTQTQAVCAEAWVFNCYTRLSRKNVCQRLSAGGLVWKTHAKAGSIISHLYY